MRSSGDAVIQVLSSTLSAGSKERSKPVGEESLIQARPPSQLRSDLSVVHFLYCQFSFIYIHISHPNCTLKWLPVHNFTGTQLNPASRSHPYPEQGNRQGWIPMQMSFLTQLGYIFLQGVIHLLDLPRSLRAPCCVESPLES